MTQITSFQNGSLILTQL